MAKRKAAVPVERIEKAILIIRGEKVILDRDLAELYQVETKQLKRAVRRNMERFPVDFMFELTKKEFENLRSHFGTSSWGGTRYMPLAFTEQGVAMLSSVLRSERAIEASIFIDSRVSGTADLSEFPTLPCGMQSLFLRGQEFRQKELCVSASSVRDMCLC